MTPHKIANKLSVNGDVSNHPLKEGLNLRNPLAMQFISKESEQTTVGALMINNENIIAYNDIQLTGDDFALESPRFVYLACVSLMEKHGAIDYVLLSEHLENKGQLDVIGGDARLTEYMNMTPSGFNGPAYAKTVKGLSRRRKLLEVASYVADLAHDMTLEIEEIETLSSAAMAETITTAQETSAKHISVYTKENEEKCDKLSENKNMITGIPTGLTALDQITKGLNKGWLGIVMGGTGMGKTTLGMEFLLTAGKHNKKGLSYTLEMSGAEYAARAIANLGHEEGLNTQLLHTLEQVWQASEMREELNKMPIHIDAETPYIEDIYNKTISHAMRHGLDYVMVDYYQLCRSRRRFDSRTLLVSHVTQTLKDLSRVLQIPVIAMGIINRSVANRPDKRPNRSDLMDGGSAEFDADLILGIYRDEVFNPDTDFPNVAEIIIDKFRHGPDGISISAYMKKNSNKFCDLEVRTAPLEPGY